AHPPLARQRRQQQSADRAQPRAACHRTNKHEHSASCSAAQQQWRPRAAIVIAAAQGAGGDRVRGLDGGHGQQQRDRHRAEEQLRAVRARHGRRGPAHGAVLQRAPAARLRLRGAGPAAAGPGLPRPGLRHPGLRPRRLLRLRRHRTRQQDRRRAVGDPAVEGGGALQGVQAAAAAARGARQGAGHRLRRALRGEHRHQRLPGELLPAGDGAVRGAHGGRVRGLPGGAGGAVPGRDPPAGRAPGHLRRAQPHGLPAAGAHAQRAPRRLRRRVQPGGPRLQRQAARHAPPPPGGAPGAQGSLRRRVPEHARPHHQPFHAGAGERGGGLLRDGEGGDVLPVQRQEPPHVRRRRQVLLLGLLPPHPEGEPVLRQEDAGPVLRAAPVMLDAACYCY
uniref:Uncharacterized protein n=1 Tax=Zea mays TaxID=4577 RepID=A0A804PVF8_MAIZE